MQPHWVDTEPRADLPAPERGWVRAIYALSEVIFESDAGTPPAPRLRWLCAELQDVLPRIGRRSRWVYRFSLWVVCLVAPLLVFRPWPLRFMDTALRARALERFERSPFGLSLFAVKAILCIVYYEHPDAASEIGFTGRSRVEALAAAGDSP